MASSSPTRFAHRLSRATGWLADRKVPSFLRRPVYGAYCRVTGANASEAQLPLEGYPSMSAFFVRRLREGARSLEQNPKALISPCDGTLQSLDRIDAGTILQAKGQRYLVRELLAGADAGLSVDGAYAWTIYLGPRDYHRVHAPFDCELSEVRWIPGTRYSVNPRVLAKRARVLATNERVVLRLETDDGTWFLVMVGALNVGRIRIIGVDHGSTPDPLIAFALGDELGRFEMGSTVVLIAPPKAALPPSDLYPGRGLQLGRVIGTRVTVDPAAPSP